MGAGFTKGPWHYGDEDESVAGVHYVDIHAGEYGDKSYRTIAAAEGPWDGDDFLPLDGESRANARLIAAAPDGHDFATAFLAYVESSDLDDLDFGRGLQGSGLIEQAKAFVAKARGDAA